MAGGRRRRKRRHQSGRPHSPRGTVRTSASRGSNNTPSLVPDLCREHCTSFQFSSGGGGSSRWVLSHWSQVQSGMNHSEAGWQPEDQPDAPLMATAASGAAKPLLRSREPCLEHLWWLGCPAGRVQEWLLPKPAEWSGPSGLSMGRWVLWVCVWWGGVSCVARRGRGCVCMHLYMCDSVIVNVCFILLCVNVCASVCVCARTRTRMQVWYE